MKITISKDSLMTGIQVVQNIVSSKATLPILSNMLLETRGNMIKLNTTDLDIGISCELPVNIAEEGAITVPAKRFSDIIKEMPVGDIVISTKTNHQIEIEGDNCRFKLNGLPKEEFPKFPEFKDKEVVKIEQKDFREMLRLTAFAASHEETNYVLSGILMEIAEDAVRLVATDGKRLAKIEKKATAPAKKEIAVIIPLKAVNEISRLLQDQGQVSFVPGTSQVLFDIDGILVATRILEQEFPNYRQVIPEPADPKIRANTQQLLAAIRRANLLSTQDFQVVKWEVFADKIVLSKMTPDVGESREEVPVQYGGKELIVGFNAQFFIDVLKNLDVETVELELLGPDRAGVIRQGEYFYLALPMRI